MLDKELEVPVVVEQPLEVQQPEQTAEAQPAPAIVEETRQAKNFKAMREKAERIERERDEYARRLQEMEAAKQPQEVEQPRYNPDDYVEGKHLNEIQKEMKKLRQELSQYQQTSATSVAEARLKAEFPDFDKVVSKENVEMLSVMEPELSETLKSSSSNIYSKAVTAYKMIKKLGIADDQDYSAEKRRIEENANKPRSVNTLGKSGSNPDSPLSNVNAFNNGTITEDEKKMLFKQMVESRKRVG